VPVVLVLVLLFCLGLVRSGLDLDLGLVTLVLKNLVSLDLFTTLR